MLSGVLCGAGRLLGRVRRIMNAWMESSERDEKDKITMNQHSRHVVRITKREPKGERYGWAICRQDHSLEVRRSTETFETLTEALLDSAHAAQSLAFPVGIDIPDPNCQAKERSTNAGCQPVKPQKQFDVDKALALGFTPETIRQLAGLAKGSTKSCAEVAASSGASRNSKS